MTRKNKKYPAAKKNLKVPPKDSIYNPNNLIFGILILISFIYYGNSISNEYALDDTIVITGNKFTTMGLNGIIDIFTHDIFTGYYGEDNNMVVGGRYRPLSVVTYAIEYELFNANPHVSHFINILLYAFTGILIIIVLTRFFRNYRFNKWFLSIPFLVSIIFIIHPVHSEVVANIKGRDEILSLMFSLLTLVFVIKHLDSKKYKPLILSSLFFFLALLSKENAITFLAVIPLSIYFFTDHSPKKNGKVFISLFIVTAIFLLLRQNFLPATNEELAKDIMNNPFAGTSFGEKYATIFYTLLIYLRLLFFPHPLTFDYYPYHIPIIQWSGSIWPWLSLAIHLGLLVYAIRKFKTKSVFSFGILYYLATLSPVSNLFFPIGAFMNERFLYMPSMGFCLVIGYFLSSSLKKFIPHSQSYKFVVLVSMLAIVLLSGFKTIQRNQAWKDNTTLFLTDVKTSSNSAKSNASAGEFLIIKAQETSSPELKKDLYKKAINYLRKAIEIYPKHGIALVNIGVAYYNYNKDLDSVMHYYKMILDINPNDPKVHGHLQKMLNNYQDNEHKIRVLEKLHEYSPNQYYINLNLGILIANHQGNFNKSLPYLEKAALINPSSHEPFFYLGTFYIKFGKETKKAVKYFEKALEINPGIVGTYENLAVAYYNLGNYYKAIEILEKAHKMNPGNKNILNNLSIIYKKTGQNKKAEMAITKVNSLD